MRVTETRNIANLRQRLSATICPGGAQTPGSSAGVSEGGRGPQQPSSQHRYTKINRTTKVGDRVPYNTIVLKIFFTVR